MRRTDNAPIGNTCPSINKVIQIIQTPTWDLSDDDQFHLSMLFSEAETLLEEIREANSQLRDWGNEQYDEITSLQKEIDNLKEQNEDINAQLISTQKELDYANDALSDLNLS